MADGEPSQTSSSVREDATRPQNGLGAGVRVEFHEQPEQGGHDRVVHRLAGPAYVDRHPHGVRLFGRQRDGSAQWDDGKA
ncbi:hypothetical protein [Streptomyces sp. NPDC052721]|uniref:hypothetical protein n=1 Tax=Streptomyces sp. NPDC052721 TaxID=3154955 RepID=UPI00342E296D